MACVCASDAASLFCSGPVTRPQEATTSRIMYMFLCMCSVVVFFLLCLHACNRRFSFARQRQPLLRGGSLSFFLYSQVLIVAV